MIQGIRYALAKAKERKFIRQSQLGANDFFIASFPKSGNTWIRYILARALYAENLVDQSNITEYFPTVYRSSPASVRTLRSPRFVKTHGTFLDLYPKTIYVTRDYRQVVLSAWHYAKNKSGFSGTIDQFADSGILNSFGPWHWHVNKALQFRDEHPERILLLQYESMLKNAEEAISQILDFTGIQPIVTIGEIAERTRFGKLQEMEKKGGQNPEQLFFRDGTNSGWQQTADWILEDKLLDKATHGIMQRLGYV